jgi:hypothetical protein
MGLESSSVPIPSRINDVNDDANDDANDDTNE